MTTHKNSRHPSADLTGTKGTQSRRELSADVDLFGVPLPPDFWVKEIGPKPSNIMKLPEKMVTGAKVRARVARLRVPSVAIL